MWFCVRSLADVESCDRQTHKTATHTHTHTHTSRHNLTSLSSTNCAVARLWHVYEIKILFSSYALVTTTVIVCTYHSREKLTTTPELLRQRRRCIVVVTGLAWRMCLMLVCDCIRESALVHKAKVNFVSKYKYNHMFRQRVNARTVYAYTQTHNGHTCGTNKHTWRNGK